MSKTFRLVGLQVEEGTICDQPMNPEAKVVLFKRRPAQTEDTMSKQKTQKNAPAEGENTDPLKALGLTEEQEEKVRQMLAAKAKADTEEEEEKRKAADPVDEEQVGKQDDEEDEKEAKKALAKRDAELAELRKTLDEERSLRLDREYLEKARSYANIPVPSEKVGSLMRAVATLEKSHSETLALVLKSCNELATSNTVITKSIGKANGIAKTGSAEDEIESIAAKKMAGDPGLTKTAAIAKAWSDNPRLALQHREETAVKR